MGAFFSACLASPIPVPKPPKELDAKEYNYSTLVTGTRNFAVPESSDTFGHVYKCDLGRQTVAVKKLRITSMEQTDLWLQDVWNIVRLKNDRLIPFLGYCVSRGNAFLVYEYWPLSLDSALFGGGQTTPLTWKQRVEIALGVAEGLDFLHSKGVFHCDLKPASILLREQSDGAISTVLAGFGFGRRLLDSRGTAASVENFGSVGYVDPNLFNAGAITEKLDSYSFGVVLLDLLSGRRAGMPGGPENEKLSRWIRSWNAKSRDARDALRNRLDPGLKEYDEEGVVSFAVLAKDCVAGDERVRPEMRQAAQELRRVLQRVTVGQHA